MDRGAWQATVHGVTKSQTWLSNKHSRAQLHVHSLPITSMQIIPKFSLYYYVKMTVLGPLEDLVTVKTEPERYVYILIPWICEYYFTLANMQNPFGRIANYRYSSWVIQLLLFSCYVVFDSLQFQWLQHARLPWLQYLLEFAQIHVHWARDAL